LAVCRLDVGRLARSFDCDFTLFSCSSSSQTAAFAFLSFADFLPVFFFLAVTLAAFVFCGEQEPFRPLFRFFFRRSRAGEIRPLFFFFPVRALARSPLL